jgi:anti-anti-sigma regulatory factor
MTMNAVWMKVDPERVLHALQQDAAEKVTSAGGEVVLDFSSVARIEPGEIKALEELAQLAGDRSVKVVLCAVNADIYRVLKLVKLAQRFHFLG